MGILTGTEKQKYTVLKSEGPFEIRFYPESILASVKMEGSYSSMSGQGFRVLAGYIFGGNEEGEKIAMTAPVRMTTKEEVNTMSFVMPSEYEMEELPKPSSRYVDLHKTQEVHTASLRFGGYANDAKITDMIQQLQQLLDEKGIQTTGPFEYLGYNAPYQFAGRRNEVLVPIDISTVDALMR